MKLHINLRLRKALIAAFATAAICYTLPHSAAYAQAHSQTHAAEQINKSSVSAETYSAESTHSSSTPIIDGSSLYFNTEDSYHLAFNGTDYIDFNTLSIADNSEVYFGPFALEFSDETIDKTVTKVGKGTWHIKSFSYSVEQVTIAEGSLYIDFEGLSNTDMLIIKDGAILEGSHIMTGALIMHDGSTLRLHHGKRGLEEGYAAINDSRIGKIHLEIVGYTGSGSYLNETVFTSAEAINANPQSDLPVGEAQYITFKEIAYTFSLQESGLYTALASDCLLSLNGQDIEAGTYLVWDSNRGASNDIYITNTLHETTDITLQASATTWDADFTTKDSNLILERCEDISSPSTITVNKAGVVVRSINCPTGNSEDRNYVFNEGHVTVLDSIDLGFDSFLHFNEGLTANTADLHLDSGSELKVIGDLTVASLSAALENLIDVSGDFTINSPTASSNKVIANNLYLTDGTNQFGNLVIKGTVHSEGHLILEDGLTYSPTGAIGALTGNGALALIGRNRGVAFTINSDLSLSDYESNMSLKVYGDFSVKSDVAFGGSVYITNDMHFGAGSHRNFYHLVAETGTLYNDGELVALAINVQKIEGSGSLTLTSPVDQSTITGSSESSIAQINISSILHVAGSLNVTGNQINDINNQLNVVGNLTTNAMTHSSTTDDFYAELSEGTASENTLFYKGLSVGGTFNMGGKVQLIYGLFSAKHVAINYQLTKDSAALQVFAITGVESMRFDISDDILAGLQLADGESYALTNLKIPSNSLTSITLNGDTSNIYEANGQKYSLDIAGEMKNIYLTAWGDLPAIANHVWVSTDGTWDSSNDWDSATNPAADDTVNFTGLGQQQVNIIGDKAVAHVIIDDCNYNASGDSLITKTMSISNSAVVNINNNTTVTGALSVRDSVVVNNAKLSVGDGSSLLNLSGEGQLVISSGSSTAQSITQQSLEIAADSEITVSEKLAIESLTGHGDLKIAGDSTINKTSDYSGQISMNSGTLEGTINLAEDLLASSGAINATLSGSGSIIKTGEAELTLSGDNSYSGGTVINGGTVSLSHVNAAGTGEITLNTVSQLLNHGDNPLDNALSLDLNNLGVSNDITINSSAKFTGEAEYSAYSSVAIITGGATYEGDIVINATKLEGAEGWRELRFELGSYGSAESINLATGKTLTVNTIDKETNNPKDPDDPFYFYSSVEIWDKLTGAGSVVLTDNGVKENDIDDLWLHGDNSYSGGTVINGGMLMLTHVNAAGTGGITLNGGSLYIYVNDYVADPTATVKNNITVTSNAEISVSDKYSGTATVTQQATLIAFGSSKNATFAVGEGATLQMRHDIDGSVNPENPIEFPAENIVINNVTLEQGSTLDLFDEKYNSEVQNSFDGAKVTITTLSATGATMVGDLTSSNITLDNNSSLTGKLSLDGKLSLTGELSSLGSLAISEGSSLDIGSLLNYSDGDHSLLSITGSVTGLDDLVLVGTELSTSRNSYELSMENQILTLHVSIAAAELSWNNIDGVWDTSPDGVEWAGSVDDKHYHDGDFVTFNGGNVTLDVEVTPGRITVIGAHDTTITGDGRIVGGTSLVMDGSGTLELNTDNAYSGGTTVSDGTLSLGHVNAVGTGNITLTGGALDLNNLAVTNDIIINGDISIGESGSYLGQITMSSGTLSGEVSLNQDMLAQSGEVSATLSGDKGISKTGEGELKLSADNSYTGGTTMSDGILSLGHRNAAGKGNITLSGGTLYLNGYAVANDIIINGDISIGEGDSYQGQISMGAGSSLAGDINLEQNLLASSGSISATLSGDAGIIKSDAGELVLTADNSYSGETRVNAGSLSINGANSSSLISVANDAALSLADGVDLANKVELKQGSSLSLGGANSIGELIATGATITGDLAASDITLNNSTLTGELSLDGSILTLKGEEISSLGSLNIISDSGIQVENLFDYKSGTHNLISITGEVSGLGMLIIDGLEDINVRAEYSLDVKDGNLVLIVDGQAADLVWDNKDGNWTGDDWTTEATDPSYFDGDNVTFNGGNVTLDEKVTPGSITVIGEHDTTIKGAGSIAGGASLVKDGSGTLELNTDNAYSGGTTVSDGTLSLGHINGAGTGIITLTGGALNLNDLAVANNIIISGDTSIGESGSYLGQITMSSGTLSGDVTLNKDMLAISGNVSATLSGDKGIIKTGDGVLTLSGDNSYSGDTQIQAGTITIDHINALGDSNVLLQGGTIDLNDIAAGNSIIVSADSSIINGESYTGQIQLESGDLAGTVNLAQDMLADAGSISATLVSGVDINIVKSTDGTLDITGDLSGHKGNIVVNGGHLNISSDEVVASWEIIVNQGSASLSGIFSTEAVVLEAGTTLTLLDGTMMEDAILSGDGCTTIAQGANVTVASIYESNLILENDSALTVTYRIKDSNITINDDAVLTVNDDASLVSLDGNGTLLIREHTLTLNADSSIVNPLTTSGGTGSIEALNITVTADKTVGDVILLGDLVVNTDMTLTLNSLSSEGDNATLQGDIVIAQSGGSYAGSYDGANISMTDVNATQALVTGSGLSISGSAGTFELLAHKSQPNVITSIHSTGAGLDLTDLGSETLELTDVSSIAGAQLEIAFDAESFANNLTTPQIVFSGADMTISNSSVLLTALDDDTLKALRELTDTEGVTILTLGDNVTLDGTTVSLEGSLLQKYIKNAEFVGNDLIVDINTTFYEDAIVSGNGAAGMEMIKSVYQSVNPQLNSTRYADLSAAMNSIDKMLVAGDHSGVNKLSAAIAGASTTALGSSMMSELERQMRSSRSRAKAAMTTASKESYSAWIAAESNFDSLGNDGTSLGHSLSSWGGSFGVDMAASEDVRMGISFTSMYGDVSTDKLDHGDGSLDTQFISLYAQAQSGKWSHNMVMSFGWGTAEMDRRVSHANGTYNTNGETDTAGWGLAYEAGYQLDKNWQVIAGAALHNSSVDSYKESGSDAALNVGKQESTWSTFGLGMALQTAAGENTINRNCMFNARAMAKLYTGDLDSSSNISLLAGGNSATVQGTEAGAFAFEMGTGVIIPVSSSNGDIFIDAALQLRSDQSSVNVSTGYRFSF